MLEYLDELTELARQERERREQFYEEITPEVKWEFINGEVIMHSPNTLKHVAIRERISAILNTFVRLHANGWSGSEKALVCLTRNDYEPDVLFYKAGNAARLTDETLKFPAPDFVVEVLSESTQRRDRGIKFTDYAAHGVAEYWIVDPWAETIEQYLLGGSEYRLASKQRNGTIDSPTVPSFSFPVRAAFDDREHIRALRAILA